MNLQALLVSSDDAAADVLGRVLSGFEIAMDRSSDPETTVERINHQRFDALILDFEETPTAEAVLAEAKKLGTSPITVALLPDTGKVRQVLASGAHFVLYKPLSDETARAGLRPAAGLLNRERRRAFRVPVQAPVEVTLPDGRKVDGILLDISETGMDVLTAEPQVAGALLAFRFQLSDGVVNLDAHGQVAWANPNGQTGVRFLDVTESTQANLREWLSAAAANLGEPLDQTAPHCKLTDLSLGGCYVETDAPFPEKALIDFCLRTKEMEVHIEGMVRVMHPAHGMGIEFPSRTAEQRAQVGELISFLQSSPGTMPELVITPRALKADLTQFERQDESADETSEELHDPLVDLLRRGPSLEQAEFITELQHQRNPEDVTSV